MAKSDEKSCASKLKDDAPPQPTLRLRVTAAAESVLRSGHPWLYADSIREQNRTGQLGEVAVVYDRRDRFLAAGLFDPYSPLRVRILHRGKPCRIDCAFWKARLAAALALRQGLFGPDTTGFRCIHGENDGLPGIVLDRYGGALVLKLYFAAWLPRLSEILEPIAATFAGFPIVLRLSKNIREIARDVFDRHEGEILTGPGVAVPVKFLENGLWFEADLLRGQKTGFFLDQRENRARVGMLAAGRHVLNAFSFSGGFSLHAASGGAKSVVDLDISAHALAEAGRNFDLNSTHPRVACCRREAIRGDAFEWLAETVEPGFDLIVLDPPSLARREKERANAIRAYGRLALSAIRRLRTHGILAAASCSAHVSTREFFEAILGAAQRTHRRHRELARTSHPPDHPIRFTEAEYLKCLFVEFEPT